MKIFYKKDFQRVLEEKEKLERDFEKYKKEKNIEVSQLNNEIEMLYADNKLLDERCSLLDNISHSLKEELKETRGSKGGLTKENNKLKSENEELNKQIIELKKKLEESMTNKYLVRKIPSGRTPNMNKTKASSPESITSYIRGTRR